MRDSSKWMKGITQSEGERYSKNFTEKILQYCLYDRYKDNKNLKFFMRNKYVFKGDWRGGDFESDVILINKNNISESKECKISRSDFSKEQGPHKKKKHEFLLKVYESEGEYLRNPKYNPDRKNSKEFRYTCPNKFTIVCQEGLIMPEEVESFVPYAGLQWVMNDGKVKTKLRNKLHPLKIDLTETLLWKFYNNSNRLDYNSYILARDYKYLEDKNDPQKLNELIEKFISDIKLRYV